MKKPIGLKQVYERKRTLIERNCVGCKKLIEIGNSYVFLQSSWRGTGYKEYYHNRRCIKKDRLKK